ncbi:unnamed protein product [Cylicostephanus goldi]|uniref:N-terminal methionine N(alpha)-acetyltransferase NatE n=1 Tax=Cylicostephanus goldi TaxID=71465 RepID=A0A3P6QT53_CYLGO|nr:unnamed protein product [Cylicostephanus goldi]
MLARSLKKHVKQNGEKQFVEKGGQYWFMSLCNIDTSNIRSVKNLHAGVFPVQYSEAYFQKVQNNDLCAALVVDGECLGVVCCKFEIVGCSKFLYIMSLAVHPLYRCRGIGSRLLDFAINKAESHSVSTIRLHVQVGGIHSSVS